MRAGQYVTHPLTASPGQTVRFGVVDAGPGLYPFVSRSFAAVDLGQMGLLNVGNVKGTMSH